MLSNLILVVLNTSTNLLKHNLVQQIFLYLAELVCLTSTNNKKIKQGVTEIWA